ncbi:unnamed protein product [Adineta steineri]|uniref:P/Homo B domain-containing protein n=1 Tax=Adineta steineri TaxID=433720 RepID=A0A815FQG6_9BILA|nr:unnamed protein product [Adineta steineri]CAF1587653.1 unnamed protein product [Adineta steineri]
MFPSIIFPIILYFLLIPIIKSSTNSLTSIVIQVNGDCNILAVRIAREHGYRYVRQIFDGFCEIEEDPASHNYRRHRRATGQNTDPVEIIRNHEKVAWAEEQTPKIRRKREFEFQDPEWNNMWYMMRHLNTPSLPDLNVTGAWKMGYTGRGRVVTFLDDGLEFDHPDLKENYDHEASTDINGNDNDPTPRYEPTNENKHGTRCAGEVSAKPNNQVCGVGIAYHARVGGVRMLDGDVTDSVEARSISHRPDHVEIYSASWGPDDNGFVVDGPGVLATKAFENGILNGRGGKGSIFVWASGNGGRSGDSCSCDGYINSIYTIAISSTTETGRIPWYLEECSGTLATAYSSGSPSDKDREIVTTDLHHGCTTHHTGTSAAAPLAAAIYALALEANPSLTWRDIMYLTVLSSRAYAIPSNTQIVQNAAGFNVSSRYGFGLMDAGLMTWYASGWKNVPTMSTCETMIMNPNITIGSNSNKMFSVDVTECKNSNDAKRQVNYIEQVQIFITLTTTNRGQAEIFLYSPSNTKTQILPRRNNDHNEQGFANWPFLTVQLWGENPHGNWKLQINTGGGSAVLMSWKLVIHGTRDNPISPRVLKETNSSPCHVECKSDKPCGETDTSCAECRHYKQPLANEKFRCVGICPEGTYPTEVDNLCLPCHSRCGSCRNASENSCIGCKPGFYLRSDTMTCIEFCPDKYYTDQKLRKCIRCKADCASCDTNSYICTSCPDGYALKDTDCVKSPETCDPSEYFDFTENHCRWCDKRCSTCSGPQSYQCTSCDKTSKFPNLQYHTCVSSCSPGFYLSQADSQCLACHDTCLNCTSSNESSCLSCKLGYVYLPESHRCEKYSGKPYYIDSNTGETRDCHSSCTQCKGPKETDCIACNIVTEVLLNDGHCVNDCPDGSYINESITNEIDTNICMPCSIGCKKCNKENQCSECDGSKGYHFQGGYCVPTCPLKTFQLNTRCEPCQYPCETCINLTSCLTCSQKLYLFNDQCVEKCPNGYYLKDKQCFKCNPLCDTCSGPSEDDCQSCAIGFIFNDKQKKCLSTCPNGNYFDKDDKLCKLCTDNCLECLYPGSYCRQCSYPMSLNESTHQCLSCCTTNVTTNDCCQCPSIWTGLCLHPLSLSSIHSSVWWLQSPIQKVRDRFSELDHRRQTAVMIFLLLTILICGVYLIVTTIYKFKSKFTHFLPSRSQPDDNREYVLLNNLDDYDAEDDDEINNESVSNATTTSII